MQNTITLKGTPFDLYMAIVPYMDLPSEISISDKGGEAQQILTVKSYGYKILLDLADNVYTLDITFTEDVAHRKGSFIDMRNILGFDIQTWDQYVYHMMFNNTGDSIQYYYRKIRHRARTLLSVEIDKEKVVWVILCIAILDSNFYDTTSITSLLEEKLADSKLKYKDLYKILRTRYNCLISAMECIEEDKDEHNSHSHQ